MGSTAPTFTHSLRVTSHWRRCMHMLSLVHGTGVGAVVASTTGEPHASQFRRISRPAGVPTLGTGVPVMSVALAYWM